MIGDASEIARVHVASWHAAYRGIVADEVLDALSVEAREERWRSILGDGERATIVLVAEGEDGAVAGFCGLSVPSRDDDAGQDTAEVGALYVDPESWRGGIGRALMDAASQELRARGFEVVTLWVLAANDRAQAFYRRYGFSADGSEAVHERSGQPVIRLRTALTG